MRYVNKSRNNSPFFQVVEFFIMFTLFLSTTVNASTDDPTGLEQIIIQIYSLIFDSSPSQTTTSGGTSSASAVDSTDDSDPSIPPPPPPK
jgi:hypothetical protein